MARDGRALRRLPRQQPRLATRSYLRRLCRALRPLERIWSAAVSIDVTDDPRLVREMALAGCTGVFVGFESLSDANLAAARKRTPAAGDYARRVGIFHDHGIQVNGSFVLGFDHDGPDVFDRTVSWIEANRLECATFHILTPYPGTPLFRRMEAEGRLLHRDWSLYDTAHVVFRPARMTPEQLAEGYACCYRRLFSRGSIWRRRPLDPRAVAPYLAMSFLYKRANPLWRLLIRHRLTAPAWRPLVEATRRRHLAFRRRLAGRRPAGVLSGRLSGEFGWICPPRGPSHAHQPDLESEQDLEEEKKRADDRQAAEVAPAVRGDGSGIPKLQE